MRDPTKARNFSPSGERFRRDHARRREWGLRQRHARKLGELYGGVSAATVAIQRRVEELAGVPTATSGPPRQARVKPAGSWSALPTLRASRLGRPGLPMPAGAATKPTATVAVTRPATAQPAAARPAAAQPATPAQQQPSQQRPTQQQPVQQQPINSPASSNPPGNSPPGNGPASSNPPGNGPASNSPPGNGPASSNPPSNSPAAARPTATRPATALAAVPGSRFEPSALPFAAARTTGQGRHKQSSRGLRTRSRAGPPARRALSQPATSRDRFVLPGPVAVAAALWHRSVLPTHGQAAWARSAVKPNGCTNVRAIGRW
jgi:hypothetical protein